MEAPTKKIKLFQSVELKKDILDWRITSFSDVLFLSHQSYGSLYSKVVDFGKIKQFEQKYKDLLKTCSPNVVKIYIIFHSLTVEQQRIFLTIHKNFQNDEGSFAAIDAGPGTGKTFLIAMILLSFHQESLYMVYSKRLMNIIDSIQFSGESKTCCKFIMDMFNIKYYESKYFWACNDVSFKEKCKTLYKLILSIPAEARTDSLYILDEDSVVSPWHIYFLFCFGKIYKKHVIFMGDRYQQNSISKTIHHKECNYSLLKNIHNITLLELHERVRQQSDPNFIKILEEITKIFKQTNRDVEVKMIFSIKYKIFLLLHKYFLMSDNYSCMYFSQYHQMLKNRMTQYERNLIKAKSDYKKVYFTTKEGNKFIPYNKKMINNTHNNKKYVDFLILEVNKDYIYTPSSMFHYRVKLLEIQPDVLIIKNFDTFEILQIRRVKLQSFFIAEEFLTILPSNLYQFPLKGLISTYHAAQGLTIGAGNIELDLDCSSLNSFYVGLTRIRNLNQLGKIHTNELTNLLITLHKNDSFYYRISKLFNGQLKDLTFSETSSLSLFNSATIARNLKIKKSKLEPKSENTLDTNLINIIKLLSLENIVEYNKILDNNIII
ncbi:Helicase 2 [Dikerogammarus haemobaphes nudivirus]|nr:Helicase 2 [Dikerogammarus haemobaphes nudivirus]